VLSVTLIVPVLDNERLPDRVADGVREIDSVKDAVIFTDTVAVELLLVDKDREWVPLASKSCFHSW
jgi:hypothetical protein